MRHFKLENTDQLGLQMTGHVLIEDDLGNTLLDKTNAIHPQNMARALARGLAGENNGRIHRVGFGNGGTDVNAARQVTYKPPNDGISDGRGYQSELYHETYSEIVDDSSVLAGLNSVTSSEVGIFSQTVTSITIASDEPSSQELTDNLSPVEATDGTFTFDELGLFTDGLPQESTSGYQDIILDSDASDSAGLTPSNDPLGKPYAFWIKVNGGDDQLIILSVLPADGVNVKFQDVINAINASSLGAVAVAEMTGDENIPSSITYGNLRIRSLSSGDTSSIYVYELVDKPIDPLYLPLFPNLQGFLGYVPPVHGQNAGLQDNPAQATTEQERLLTHLIFSPILKSANRTLKITYTLAVQVARSV